jgi:hypothetical protein
MAQIHITPPPLSDQSMADLYATITVLCFGKHRDGKPFWAYMQVKPSMAKAFREARESGECDLEDYGTVVEWGEGQDVPPRIKVRMERNHGIRHNYEREILKMAQIMDNALSN